MRLFGSLAGTIAVVLLTGCGYSTTSPATGNNPSTNQSGGHTSSITLSNSTLTFSPSIDTVAVNTTVTWTWPTDGSAIHNVTFQDGTASPDQATGTYQRTFSQAGTYAYRCTHHSISFTSGSMIGTIVVQ